MHRIAFRLDENVYAKLRNYQRNYRIKFGHKISLNKIVNNLIIMKMPSVKMQKKTWKLYENYLARFNDSNYRKMTVAYSNLENQLSGIKRDLDGVSNNLNQIAHSENRLLMGDSKFAANFDSMKNFLYQEGVETKIIHSLDKILKIDLRGGKLWERM